MQGRAATKTKFSKHDKLWSRLVRERDGKCLHCGRTEFLDAHHFIGRSKKSCRLILENGVSLCKSCHTFNNEFSAHRTPDKFRVWFRKNFLGRYKFLKTLERKTVKERDAIKEFM